MEKYHVVRHNSCRTGEVRYDEALKAPVTWPADSRSTTLKDLAIPRNLPAERPSGSQKGFIPGQAESRL